MSNSSLNEGKKLESFLILWLKELFSQLVHASCKLKIFDFRALVYLLCENYSSFRFFYLEKLASRFRFSLKIIVYIRFYTSNACVIV